MIVRPSIILLQPLVGRFHASDFDFQPTFRQFGHQVAVPQRCRLATTVLDWHCLCDNSMMNTPSMIVRPSVTLGPLWRVEFTLTV